MRSTCLQVAVAAERQPFDLSVLAGNGLRRGRTTGSCATAAVKAALHLLLFGERPSHVAVTLPGRVYYLVVPVQRVAVNDDGSVRAEVLKDGGDDPDSTHGATIFAEVCRNQAGEVRFFAGRGVGTATLPGLRVAVGEPAINPVPRQMMRQAVAELSDAGFDLTIGCENGEEIARKTFNPRLGIVGGISILGTSGIVEPMSLATWIASVEVYVRVALADDAPCVAYLPGKIGREFARDVLGLPSIRTVQIANFLGDALAFTETALREAGRQLDVLWLAGHPGKLAKVLDGYWDTHSSKSAMAMAGVARVAQEQGFTFAQVAAMEQANTVEAAMETIRHDAGARALWIEIERRIGVLVAARVPSVRRVEVRLFDLSGNALGQTA